MRSLIAISEGVSRQWVISGSVANSWSGIMGVDGMRSRRGWVLEWGVICWVGLGGGSGGWEGGVGDWEGDGEWLEDCGRGGGEDWVCSWEGTSMGFCGCGCCSDWGSVSRGGVCWGVSEGAEVDCVEGGVDGRNAVWLADGIPGTSGFSWTSFAFSTLISSRRMSSISASIRASSCRSLVEGGAGGFVFPGGRPRPRFGGDESAFDEPGPSGGSLER